MPEPVQTFTTRTALGLVAFGPRSGYDLAQLAGRSVGLIWAPSRSQLYKALGRLRDDGLIEGTRIAQESRPSKTVYRMTERGRSELVAWLHEIDDDPDEGQAAFPVKLFFCGSVDASVTRAHLDAYARYLTRRAKELDLAGQLPIDSPHARAILEHGRRRLEATRAWIEWARREVDMGRLHGSDLAFVEPGGK